MRSSKTKSKRDKKSRGSKAADDGIHVKPGQTVIYTGPGFYAPDRIVCELSWLDETYQRNNVGSPNASWRVRANSVFDPDPALGTGGIVGMTYLASLYLNYRVLAYAYEWHVSNLEAFPVLFASFPTVSDIGLNAAAIAQYTEGPRVTKGIASAQGGLDRITLSSGWISIEEVIGSKTVLYDDNYVGSTAANPTAMTYQNFAAIPGKAVNLSQGWSSNLRIRYKVAFFARKPITA